METRASNGPTTVYLAKLFDDDEGPNAVVGNTAVLQELAASEIATVEEQERSITQDAFTPEKVLTKAKQEKKDNLKKKAEAAVAARKATKRARGLAFGEAIAS